MNTITEHLHHGNTLVKTETHVLALDASGVLAALDGSPYAYSVSAEGAAHMAEQLRTTGETSHGWSRFTAPAEHFVKVEIGWMGSGTPGDPWVMTSWDTKPCACDTPWRHGYLA